MSTPDPALTQLEAAATAAQMRLATEWHYPTEMLPDTRSWAPLHALRELRSGDDTLAHDAVMTILMALSDSPDPQAGWLDMPPAWWDTPLGRELATHLPAGAPIPSGWQTIADTAAILHVSRDTVLRWVKAGKFPGAHRQAGVAGYTGWRWMIPTADIEATRRTGATDT